MSIYLTALVKSKPGKAEELKAVLQNMVVHSRQETACLQYDLHQSTEDENLFIFQEEWTSAEGLAAHNQQAYITDFVAVAPELTESAPLIYLTQKIS
ncbi:putative quinol monooxygenase [Pedobacter sp. ASV12]|uniref:putative quinol monooxygenase n=1 Tax=Pedobacter sp. ASV12 TaxID=2795120 RepID=UPI0018ED35DC|nr:putative quinol monooxygenase [Pedobacter sp. ASV12]